MANSFTNVFTGNPVAPTFNTYKLYNIIGNTTLVWATEFIDTPNIVYQWMDFSANAGGYHVLLPDASKASVGQFMIIRNTSGAANSFIIQDNIGGNIATLAVGQAIIVALTNNSTIAGSWTTLPFAGGFSAVTSVAATALTAGITIGGSPITNAGTLTFSLANALVSLSSLGTNGILAQTSPGVIGAVDIVGGLNIDVADGDGIAGNPTINLSDTLTGMSSINVGNFNISNNTISTIPANTAINIIPNGTGSILLGQGLTPPTVTSTGDLNNVVNLMATTGTIGKISLSTINITSTDVSGNLTIGASGTGTFTLKSQSGTNNLTMNTNGTIFHPSVAKAWISFNAAGTVASSYNITSLVKTGTGQFTITVNPGVFTGLFLPIATSSFPGGNASITGVSSTTNQIALYTTKDNTNSFADSANNYIVMFGN